jgi:hypothetical protein
MQAEENLEMKKRYGIVLAIVMAVPVIAMAGSRFKWEVEVHTDHGWAAGSMGSARNSRDSNQYIGCQFTGTLEGHWGICHARDATGTYAACSFVNKDYLARAISAIADSSTLVFAWNQDGECRDITVNNNSAYEPRK